MMTRDGDRVTLDLSVAEWRLLLRVIRDLLDVLDDRGADETPEAQAVLRLAAAVSEGAEPT